MSRRSPTEVSGRVFDIKRFALHDGPGVRVTVFLKGCPLRCLLCHNPESQTASSEVMSRPGRGELCADCLAWLRSRLLSDGPLPAYREVLEALHPACATAYLAGAVERVGRTLPAGAVREAVLRDEVFFAASGGGVTFSGGEPLAQPEFLEAMLRLARDHSLHTTVDTSGHADQAVCERLLPLVDRWLYDLKLIDPGQHRDLTGVDPSDIQRNLHGLAEAGAEVVVRLPLLPGLNDDRETLEAIGTFVAGLPMRYPVDLLPYHRLGEDKYARLHRGYARPGLAPPTPEAVARAADVLSDRGLDVTVRGMKRRDPDAAE